MSDPDKMPSVNSKARRVSRARTRFYCALLHAGRRTLWAIVINVRWIALEVIELQAIIVE